MVIPIHEIDWTAGTRYRHRRAPRCSLLIHALSNMQHMSIDERRRRLREIPSPELDAVPMSISGIGFAGRTEVRRQRGRRSLQDTSMHAHNGACMLQPPKKIGHCRVRTNDLPR